MKIVPDHRYPRGTRGIFVESISNNSVSCGSVVPCVEHVETSNLLLTKPRTKFYFANAILKIVDQTEN